MEAKIIARQKAIQRIEAIIKDHQTRGFYNFEDDFESYFSILQGLRLELQINKKALAQLLVK